MLFLYTTLAVFWILQLHFLDGCWTTLSRLRIWHCIHLFSFALSVSLCTWIVKIPFVYLQNVLYVLFMCLLYVQCIQKKTCLKQETISFLFRFKSFFYRYSQLNPVSKQCRAWSDATSCGVWSVSALFAYIPQKDDRLLHVCDNEKLNTPA